MACLTCFNTSVVNPIKNDNLLINEQFGRALLSRFTHLALKLAYTWNFNKISLILIKSDGVDSDVVR